MHPAPALSSGWPGPPSPTCLCFRPGTRNREDPSGWTGTAGLRGGPDESLVANEASELKAPPSPGASEVRETAPSCCGSEAAASKPTQAPWRKVRRPRMAPGAHPGRSGSCSLPQGLGACTHVHTSDDDDLPRKPRPGVHHRDLGFRPRQGRPARAPPSTHRDCRPGSSHSASAGIPPSRLFCSIL